MFLLIWAALLFSVRSSNADTGVSLKGRQECGNGFCITLNGGVITAEAGLCVVIPCAFTTPNSFTPKHLVWYRCEPFQRCGDSDMIFHSNKNNKKLQATFIGRVSLLEPDVTQKNCSIIISDLSELDSGSYHFRINGYMSWRTDGFSFTPQTTVSVKGLSQKPTVMIPPLTEGQQATLSCTAPGLCSGSDPTITWMWRGAGENSAHITGNITAVKTENVTAVRRRHSSTLTFNPSDEHHGTEVTCKVSFTGSRTTEETMTLIVTYVKISGKTSVKEGETLNLTCGVEGFNPSSIKWTKVYVQNLPHGTEQSGMATLSISNVTTEDSGQYMCIAKHLNNTLKKSIDVKVMYLRKPGVTGKTTVKEGETLNLTCSVESFPPSLLTWMKFSKQNLQNTTQTNLQNNTQTYVLRRSIVATLSISNVTAEDSGQYICTVIYMNNSLEERVDTTVIYLRKPGITGKTSVKEGDVLNLTCSAESFPPSHVMWTKLGSNKTLHNVSENSTRPATLFIPNVTAEHSGQYMCTGKTLDMTVTVHVDVTVTWISKIQNVSGCEAQSNVLTCVCISEGVPLPTIKWPLLKNHTEYSVITIVSNHTVNSTVVLTVKDHCNIFVECVSSNDNEEAKENLTIRDKQSKGDDQAGTFLAIISRWDIITAFLIGILLSTIVCCLTTKCHRRKPKSSGNLDETLEMMSSHADLMYHGQAVEEDQTHSQEVENGAVAAESTAPEPGGGPTEVEYANIDFSLLKRRSPVEAAKKQETTKTEYAEIKKVVQKEDADGEEGEMLEDKEVEAMTEEDDETKHCVLEVEGAEQVYSNVQDIMGEI